MNKLHRHSTVVVERDLSNAIGWVVWVDGWCEAWRYTRWGAERVADRFRKAIKAKS